MVFTIFKFRLHIAILTVFTRIISAGQTYRKPNTILSVYDSTSSTVGACTPFEPPRVPVKRLPSRNSGSERVATRKQVSVPSVTLLFLLSYIGNGWRTVMLRRVKKSAKTIDAMTFEWSIWWV